MHIFCCAGGKFGEVAGVSPDDDCGGIGRWGCASGVLSVRGLVRVRHRTLGTGHRLNPVGASGAA